MNGMASRNCWAKRSGLFLSWEFGLVVRSLNGHGGTGAYEIFVGQMPDGGWEFRAPLSLPFCC